MQEKRVFFATTAKSLEPLLAEELNELGAQGVEEAVAGVHFLGDLEMAYRACLWSRVGNRILLPIDRFEAPNPEKLYGKIKSINWGEHLGPHNTLAVEFNSSRSQITHTQFGALKVKDAIVDQMRSIHGSRPSIDVEKPDVRVNVYLHEDQAQVSIDLSGRSLHERGYREKGVAAPLKENLAASLLLLAGWKEACKNGAAFLDPMCGSGTLPIEAAYIATQTAPGILRDYFGFLGWKQHDPKIWKQLLEEAQSKIIHDPKKVPKIVGTDEDFRAIRAALANSERAGLTKLIHFEKRAWNQAQVLETHSQNPAGIVILNPPYGERLGEIEELKELYGSIGDGFKKIFKGWTGFVLTSNPNLAKSIGLKPSRKFVVYNGALECRLLKFDIY